MEENATKGKLAPSNPEETKLMDEFSATISRTIKTFVKNNPGREYSPRTKTAMKRLLEINKKRQLNTINTNTNDN